MASKAGFAIETAGGTFVEELSVARGFWGRFRGLMFRAALPEAAGLLLVGVDAVHMLGMRFAIDVVFLSRDRRVLKIEENLSPWTGLAACRGAWAALEVSAGRCRRCGLRPGMQLRECGPGEERGVG